MKSCICRIFVLPLAKYNDIIRKILYIFVYTCVLRQRKKYRSYIYIYICMSIRIDVRFNVCMCVYVRIYVCIH